MKKDAAKCRSLGSDRRSKEKYDIFSYIIWINVT